MKPYSKKLDEIDKNINAEPAYKHLLKCSSCLWNITFYDSIGFIPINSNIMHCPMCKEKNRNSKIKIIS